MKNKKNELVLSAITLVRVGEALEECLLLQQERKVLEAEHVQLKNRITRN